MTKRKKKYRIRWDRVIMLLAAIAAVCVAIYYAIVGLIALWGWITTLGENTNDTDEVIIIDSKKAKESLRMSQNLDSMMARPMLIDTSKVAMCIYDLTSRQYVYNKNDEQLLPPASCMKIPTAIAAVKMLGINHRYTESLQIKGKMHGDTLVGNLLLRADDDPLVETFNDLTDRLRNRGIRVIRGNIYYHLMREDTLRPHPSAKMWDISYYRTPLLLKGKRFIDRSLKGSLYGSGIRFIQDGSVAPEGDYRVVAQSSHALRDVLTPMIIHSSNIKAEAVFYHLDYKAGLIRDHRRQWNRPHAVEQFLRKTFCTDTVMFIDKNRISESTHTMQGFIINDGSGLSPDNRLTASSLVDMLRYAYADKQLHDYFFNEAFASPADPDRCGSLIHRMWRPEYKGRLYCKTGTLVTIGGSSLSGYLHGSDGHWYAFSIINTDTPVYEARKFQDQICKMMMGGKR